MRSVLVAFCLVLAAGPAGAADSRASAAPVTISTCNRSDQNDCFVDYVHFTDGSSWSRPAR